LPYTTLFRSRNRVSGTIGVHDGPLWVAITPDGRHAYSANAAGSVSVIDLTGDRVSATVPAGQMPDGVAVTSDGQYAYVADTAGALTILSVATNKIVATIPVAGSPKGVAVVPGGHRAYVTDFGANAVRVVDADMIDRALHTALNPATPARP
jgi:YVTN family beta-propeller protein